VAKVATNVNGRAVKHTDIRECDALWHTPDDVKGFTYVMVGHSGILKDIRYKNVYHILTGVKSFDPFVIDALTYTGHRN
jgi:hypothetical protein